MSAAQPIILYENRFSDATPAASTTATGYSVLNVRDWRPYTWWKPTASPSTITVNCGSAKAADYGLVYAEAGTYEIRGSTDNFGASDVLKGTITLTATGLGLVQFASVSYQYWRVKSTSGTPAIAIASIGAALTIPAWPDQGFDPLGRKVHGEFNRSVMGNPLGRVTDWEEWSDELKFTLVSTDTGWTWARNTFLPAWRAHLRDKPFVYAWEPGDHPTELVLVAARDEFSTPHQSGSLCDLRLPVTGVIT